MKRIVSLLVALMLVLAGCAMPVGDVGTAAGPSEDATEETADSTVGDGTAGSETDAEEGESDAASSVAIDESAAADPVTINESAADLSAIDESGTYTSKDEVALYLHTYGHLPSNYVTKDEAEDAGWKTEGLDLSEAVPGKSIGGDRFGNREGLLPKAAGRTYYECDIDYPGHGSRGPKRLVYSNDGLIFYTEDHYQTFEQLYGEES